MEAACDELITEAQSTGADSRIVVAKQRRTMNSIKSFRDLKSYKSFAAFIEKRRNT